MSKTFNKMISVIVAFVMFFVCLSAFPVRHTVNSVGGAEVDCEIVAETMAARINEEREKIGLQPLKIVPYLNVLSELRANEIAELYSHTRYDGTTIEDIIDTEIVDYCWSGEILGRGTVDIDRIIDGWKYSEERHWDIVTHANATHFGMAVVYMPDHPKKWLWAGILVETFDHEDVQDQRWPLENAIAPEYCGDVSGDGVIDSFDLVMLNQYINDSLFFNTAQQEAADVFDDGIITKVDATALKMYILGEVDKLPVTLEMLT